MAIEGLEERELEAPKARPERRDAGGRRRFVTRSRPNLAWYQTSSAPVAEGAVPEDARVRHGRYRHTLATVDAAMCAIVLQILLPMLASRPDLGLTAGAMVLTVFLSHASGLYDRDDLLLSKSTLDEAPKLLQVATFSTLLVWFYLDAATRIDAQAGSVMVIWVGSFVLLIFGRLVGRRIVGSLAATERCLVVGEEASVAAVGRQLNAARLNADVVASVTMTGGGGSTPDELLALIRRQVRRYNVHRVIIAPGPDLGRETMDMLRAAKHAGVQVSLLPRMIEVIGSTVEFDHVAGLTMLGVRRFGLSRSSRMIKRAFDLVGSSVLLLAAAPTMAVIAVLVRFDPSGPGHVIFRQTRVGKHGNRFQMLKFRSMEVDAESRKDSLRCFNETEGLFKIADDPRVTRVGRFLRRTSLDELPQLVNVWCGEMSLVGPRPLVVDEDELVQGLNRHRLHLTPGMTGHWQILGAARVPMHEMVGIDYLYVANWSLWTDVKIVLRTIPHVLGSRGM